MLKEVLDKLDYSSSKNDIIDDITAGLSVAAIALPQNMAYALILGLDPIYGLYTSIVSMFIASLIGVSDYLIVGPTNLIVVAIASGLSGISSDQYLEAVLLLTFMMGVFQLLLALFKLGDLVNYISRSVIGGLTAGVAVIIFSGQLDNLFGLELPSASNVFMELYYFIVNINQLNFYSVFVGGLTILTLILLNKYKPKLPNYLIAMIIPVAIVYFTGLQNNLEVVENFPAKLPSFSLHSFDLGFIAEYWSTALSVALLGFIQSLSVIKSLELKSGQEVKINRVFLSQGIINLVCSFFNSFGISGSFTNSFTNYQSGARSRLSELITAITIVLFIIFFSPLTGYIPIPSLAGLVIVVAIKMVDIEEIRNNFRNKFDSLIFLATFITTISLPRLDYAVYFGVIVSFILVLKSTSSINYSHYEYEDRGKHFHRRELSDIKNGNFEKGSYILINLSGNISFNASENLKHNLDESYVEDQAFIIRLRDVENIDLTSLKELEAFIDRVKESGGKIILSGIDNKIFQMFDRYGIVNKVGRKNVFMADDLIFSSTKSAIEKVREED
ncbi:MAG: SulP family inorganic anion transporter [Bacillota bacterium]